MRWKNSLWILAYSRMLVNMRDTLKKASIKLALSLGDPKYLTLSTIRIINKSFELYSVLKLFIL